MRVPFNWVNLPFQKGHCEKETSIIIGVWLINKTIASFLYPFIVILEHMNNNEQITGFDGMWLCLCLSAKWYDELLITQLFYLS